MLIESLTQIAGIQNPVLGTKHAVPLIMIGFPKPQFEAPFCPILSVKGDAAISLADVVRSAGSVDLMLILYLIVNRCLSMIGELHGISTHNNKN